MVPINLCILILFCACLVKCDVPAGVIRSINGKKIDRRMLDKICAEKTCITKCCPPKGIVSYSNQHMCVNRKNVEKLYNVTLGVQYYMANVYRIDTDHRTMVKTAKNISEPPFYIIHNSFFHNTGPYIPKPIESYHLMQDGILARPLRNRYKKYVFTEALHFCVDVIFNSTAGKGAVIFKITPSSRTPEMQEEINKYWFTAISLLISCFFMILTLLVYALLPHLRTMGGRILMALISTFTMSFLLKATINLLVIPQTYDEHVCAVITPLYYFTIVSSFFWLNVMSFDLFWTLRGARKSREIHRRGEIHKFLIYCLYAYGTPLILTVTALVIDNVEVGPDVIKPFFNTCQNKKDEIALYQSIPNGILIIVNCLLFLLTTYNIYMTRKGVNINNESRNTKANKNSFQLYLKLSVIMGASWILEAIQFVVDVPFWLFIILTAYNVLIGVTIFFLFVFKKKIYNKLCVRFNIKSSFVENMQTSNSSRTAASRTPGSTKSNNVQQIYNNFTTAPRKLSLKSFSVSV